jgi:hypothetical protein
LILFIPDEGKDVSLSQKKKIIVIQFQITLNSQDDESVKEVAISMPVLRTQYIMQVQETILSKSIKGNFSSKSA